MTTQLHSYRKRLGFLSASESQYTERNGEPFAVIGAVLPPVDPGIPGYAGVPLLRIRFESDGHVTDAWPDEVLEVEDGE